MFGRTQGSLLCEVGAASSCVLSVDGTETGTGTGTGTGTVVESSVSRTLVEYCRNICVTLVYVASHPGS